MSNEPIPLPEDAPESAAPSTLPPPKRLKFWLGVAAALAIGLAAAGVIKREIGAHKLAEWTEAQSVPAVELAQIKQGSGEQTLALPGEIRAFTEAQIRARVNGYVKDWRHDIGDRVQAGELLATIDAPELDQQIEQAKGELARAEAHAQLAKLTSKRWAALRASTAVSQQSVDEKGGDVNAKIADVSAARANVERLKAMKSFTDITAPFAGVVTARKIDVGVLVSATNSQELFDVADIHQVRIYVRAPQAFAPRLRPGMRATLALPQYPGRSFEAKVIGTSNAIAEKSRTLLVQLLADNPEGALLPGSYTEARFILPRDRNAVRIPASALLFRNNGLQIATVTPENIVAMKRITVDRDLGAEVEVLSGVSPSEKIINNPSDSIRDGDKVQIVSGDMNEVAKEREKREDKGG